MKDKAFMISAKLPHRPDWVLDAVFYQIFPDRFARGSSASTDVQPWGSPPTRDNFLGGDLDGIIDHLDHLVDLGITALYLTPIFTAGTNHRYDTCDYTRIDPMLGDEAAFDGLIAAARHRGIAVVLDAVLHHCGEGHWAFRDVIANGPASPYADWFFIDSYPVTADPEPTYQTCSGCWYLPKLNVDNPELRQYLFDAIAHWTAKGIDGWRLDVPYMIDSDTFWPEFRRVVREVNPDAYIVAEVWEEAGQWTSGTTSDAAMNYQLRDALLAFFVDRRTGATALADHAAAIDTAAGDAGGHMLNLLASHDTARLRTTCGGEPDLTVLAMATMLAMRGTPMIYYGDEVGMTGFNDPECRGAMPWEPDTWDTHTLESLQRFIAARAASVALRRGTQHLSAATDDVVHIQRNHPDQTVDIYANRADVPAQITPGHPGCDLLTGTAVAAGPLQLPRRGIVYVERKTSR